MLSVFNLTHMIKTKYVIVDFCYSLFDFLLESCLVVKFVCKYNHIDYVGDLVDPRALCWRPVHA